MLEDPKHPYGGPSSHFDPSSYKSHLFHALEGLDRYPNYLQRWSMNDVESLERALENKLEEVKVQKQQILERRRRGFDRLVQKLVDQDKRWESLLQPPDTWDDVKSSILDARAVEAIFRSSFFVPRKGSSIPSVHDVLSGSTSVQLDVGYLEEWMDEEMFDVYSFPLFSTTFCETLKDYIRSVIQLLDSDEEFAELRSGMTKDLDYLGLRWLNDLLFHLVVRPIARHIFKETEIQGDLDWRQGYIAAYSASPSNTKPRQRLVPHTDDSEVTLNVCIGDVFQGGLLAFHGLRGMDDAGHLFGEYKPQIGCALLHAGRHFHEVTEVTSGDRYAFIMWARSWSGTRAQKCPCCWLNRRTDNSCICGTRWN